MHILPVATLSLVLIFGGGCIHVAPIETKKVELPFNPHLSEAKFGALVCKSLLYQPSKLPLDDFFSRVSRGEFQAAFGNIDLDYRPSNVDNQALRRLIGEGFLPLYLEVHNTGLEPIALTAADFKLDNGHRQVSALANTDLPSAFKSFNPEAAMANAANVGILVVSAVAIVATVAVVAAGCKSNCNWGPIQGYGTSSNSRPSRKVFNKTTKTTSINYQDYLFRPGTLAPGESAKGLLFFKVGNMVALKEYKLMISNQPS